MLAKEESLFPTMYANLRRALVPLMDDDAYAAMGKTSAEVSMLLLFLFLLSGLGLSIFADP